MATTAHCAYCFEALSADLEDRKALEFEQVQGLWAQFELLNQANIVEDATGEDGEMDEERDGMADAEEQEGDEMVEEQQIAPPSSLQLPSISRLQAASPASASSSSTPSSLSTSSSSRALGDNSKSSSDSSFFSFKSSKQPSPAAPQKEEEHPLFVTWNTISRRTGNKSLRGCIGTFDPQELSDGLKSYALTAAFEDTRFSPISLPELPSLSVSVTLLTFFTPCAHALDWDLGTHGIRISFHHHGKRYGATYLPDVAVEQGWTKEETMVSLMRKAGWVGRSRDWRHVKGLTVVRYQGKKTSLGYEEWKVWRDWVRNLGVR